MKTKITVTKNKNKQAEEYPEVPFVILMSNGSYAMLVSDNFSTDIRCLNLETGDLYNRKFSDLKEYFREFPDDKIVESEVFITQ